MPRIIEPFKQFFDNDGSPLVNGWLKFLVSGTNNTDKATYADSNEIVANSNPLQLDAAGRCPNVWGTGAYRVISYTNDEVLSQPAVQIEMFDPVNAEGSVTGSLTAWDSTTTYSVPDVVVADDLNYYRSLTNSNVGNDPTLDSTNWELVDFNQVYNSSANYSQYEVVVEELTGIRFLSLQSSNLGNALTNASYWRQISLDSVSPTLLGNLDTNSQQIQESIGADIASAGALPLLTDGNSFTVTGTASISSIASSGKLGTLIELHFEGVLTITHDNDNIKCLTSASIETEAGDFAVFREYASGKWRMIHYTRLSGKPLIPTYVSDAITKAWVVFDGTAVDPITPKASYNVDGNITKNATGDYTINWDDDLPDGDYAWSGGVTLATAGTTLGVVSAVTKAAGSLRIRTEDASTGTDTDYPDVCIQVIG